MAVCLGDEIMGPIEQQFLRLLAGGSDTGGELSELEWQELAQLSTRLGLAPYLYERLRRGGAAPGVPEAVWQMLRRQQLQTGGKNLRLYQALHQLLVALRAEHAPAIVLKGAYLARSVYGSIALRPMLDIDVLIRPEDLDTVDRVVTAQGYARCEPDSEQEPHHFAYLRSADGAGVEIHWDIRVLSDPPVRVDLDGLWQRAVRYAVGDVEALALSPEDLLLHLCLHTSVNHMFNHFGLRTLVDVSLVLAAFGAELDWGLVSERARQWGIERGVFLTLWLAGQLLKAPVPSGAMAGLRCEVPDRRLLSQVRRRLFAEVNDSLRPWSESIGSLRHPRSPADALATLGRSLLPAPSEIARRYGLSPDSRRVYLYYLLRLCDSAPRNVRRLWLLVRGDPGVRDWVERESGRSALRRWLAPAP